jgi:protein tyrosine/serine phosphatase
VESKGKSRLGASSNLAYSEMIDTLSEETDYLTILNSISEHRKGEIDYLTEQSLGALDSIKILDSFSSYYITEWLSNLGIILNDLLRDLNLSVEFSIICF